MDACKHGAGFVEGPPYPDDPAGGAGRYCRFCGASLREVEATREPAAPPAAEAEATASPDEPDLA